MADTSRGSWAYLSDHPKMWGVVSLLALALSYSPRVSITASWICITLAGVLGFAAIAGVPCIRDSRRPRVYTVASWAMLVAVLISYGLWLRPPRGSSGATTYVGPPRRSGNDQLASRDGSQQPKASEESRQPRSSSKPSAPKSEEPREDGAAPAPSPTVPAKRAGHDSAPSDQPPPLLPKEITIASQQQVHPAKGDPPYATEVTLHTTADVSPVWLALQCDAEIADIYCYVGQGEPLATLRSCGHAYSQDRKTVWFHFQEPKFSPQASLIVTLKAMVPIAAKSVRQERPPAGSRKEPGGAMCIRKCPDSLQSSR